MTLTALINHLAAAAARLEGDGHDPSQAEVLLATDTDTWSRKHTLGAVVTYGGAAYLIDREGSGKPLSASVLEHGERHD